MKNGDVGSVSGGNNVSWSADLAKKLDKQDGKEDGKINASIWNSFLDSVGSKGNKINNFITLDRAEKSFNYYKNKKDSGNVDWSDSNKMFDKFVQEQEGTQQTQTNPANNANNAEQNTYIYTVQKGELLPNIIKRSLMEQGINNPTSEQIENAIKEFDKLNPGAIHTNQKGVRYLYAGAQVKLNIGDTEKNAYDSLKMLKQTNSKADISEIKEFNTDELRANLNKSKYKNHSRQISEGTTAKEYILSNNKHIRVLRNANGDIFQISTWEGEQENPTHFFAMSSKYTWVDGDNTLENGYATRKQENNLLSFLPQWIIDDK